MFASLGSFERGGDQQEVVGTATIWGTLDRSIVTTLVGRLAGEYDIELAIEYEQFSEETFENAIIQALARGTGPDALLLPHESLIPLEEVIFTIPYESYPERTFLDSFIEEGELYLNRDGVMALPVFVDPLVLYWNRTLFNNAALARPPKYWDELLSLTPKLTKIDANRNIIQSTIALGEFSNIEHAKEILVVLFMQAGTPLTVRNASDNAIVSVLNSRFGLIEQPAVSALRFYTEFSNPVKPVYSWNRGLLTSQTSFLAETLAMYIGFAHELPELQQKNPNLNFDVTLIPQIRESSNLKTFGRLYGLALLKQSKQMPEAFQAISLLSGPEAAVLWAEVTGLAPTRRDVLIAPPQDPYLSLFYEASIRADAFLDPDTLQSASLFRNMIEDITSGKKDISGAVDTAHRDLDALLKRI